MSSEDNTSSIQSYIDQATGTVQSALGSLTGSTADQAQGQDRKDKGALENDLSHAAAKAGPFTLSASGAVAQDSPDRTAGSWDQTVGSAKEAIGNALGSEDLRRTGIQQNESGKQQEAKGQLSDLGEGVGDRVKGTVGGAVAGVLGDDKARQDFQETHDVGKTRQRGAEADIDKKAGY